MYQPHPANKALLQKPDQQLSLTSVKGVAFCASGHYEDSESGDL